MKALEEAEAKYTVLVEEKAPRTVTINMKAEMQKRTFFLVK
jgi:hypothetical protein